MSSASLIRVFGRTLAPGAEADDMLRRHPLTSRVVGFACTRISVTEEAIVCEPLNASLGPEARVIATAAACMHNHRGDLLSYAGGLWTLRMLARRAVLLGMPERFVLSKVIERSHDLGDFVMRAAGEEAPPIEVVAEIFRFPPRPCAMSVPAMLEAMRKGDHVSVLEDVVWHLETITHLYAATYLADRLPLHWKAPLSPTNGDAGDTSAGSTGG